MLSRVRFTQPTGLMFHHFHGNIHPLVQGSIDASQFRSILEAVGFENILAADEWICRATAGTLSASDTCVTFDDALLCQYDVAKPVLDTLGIKAFWFIYTSVFDGVAEKLELFRLFRSTAFASIEDFYAAFFSEAERKLGQRYQNLWAEFDPKTYLPNSPFYTASDRWFRYLRDRVLEEADYFLMIESMMDDAGFDRAEAIKNLWLRASQVQQLVSEGHVIGLHSHTHPTTMGLLSRKRQKSEYMQNADHIFRLTGKRPSTVSHPCNSYNNDTIDILSEMGVSMGFRADVAPVLGRGPLEFAREDHANMLRMISKAP